MIGSSWKMDGCFWVRFLTYEQNQFWIYLKVMLYILSKGNFLRALPRDLQAERRTESCL